MFVFYLLATDFFVLKIVFLCPSLSVPPICPWLCSGISITFEMEWINILNILYNHSLAYKNQEAIDNLKPSGEQ